MASMPSAPPPCWQSSFGHSICIGTERHACPSAYPGEVDAGSPIGICANSGGVPMRSRTILLAALTVTLAVPLTGAPTQAQQLQQIKITVPTVSTIFYPLYYGQDKGIFAKEGLEIEVISTNGDGPDVDAVISGSAQFSISTPNRLFTSFDQGKPLKAIGMLARRMAIDCAMNKQVADKLGVKTDMPLDARLKTMKGQIGRAACRERV